MVQFRVGDTVVLCASIDDFCGQLGNNAYEVKNINISTPPCNITTFMSDCLNFSGMNISFSWVARISSPMSNSCPSIIKNLGTATTNAQGIASLQYTITQQDLDLFNANSSAFDLAACITNSPITYNNDVRNAIRPGDLITIVGLTPPTATHVFQIKLSPYSWYTPQGAVDNLVTRINDFNGAIMNVMSSFTGWSYVQTTFSHDGTYVYINVYMREITGVQTLSPLTIGQLALVLVAIAIIGLAVGTWLDSFFGPVSSLPTKLGLSNKDLGSAGDTYIKKELTGCEVNCADPSYTQDQKANCIKICMDNELLNWKDYQNKLTPKADHTPLDTGVSEIQKCYDTYNSSARSTADYQTFITCMQLKANEAVTKDTSNIYAVYPPDAPAGVTAQDQTGACWIPGPLGGCILSANTGKTIAIIGGVLIGGYVLLNLIKK